MGLLGVEMGLLGVEASIPLSKEILSTVSLKR
jgi:hypothetical protein